MCHIALVENCVFLDETPHVNHSRMSWMGAQFYRGPIDSYELTYLEGAPFISSPRKLCHNLVPFLEFLDPLSNCIHHSRAIRTKYDRPFLNH
jgi:hypothetical protein